MCGLLVFIYRDNRRYGFSMKYGKRLEIELVLEFWKRTTQKIKKEGNNLGIAPNFPINIRLKVGIAVIA